MAFLGLRKWPTPVGFFPLHRWCNKLTRLQIVKPLWPFMIAGSLTVYLFAKAQESGIRCALAVVLHGPSSNSNVQLLSGATTPVILTPLNSPRNLYTRRNVSTLHGGLIEAGTLFFELAKPLILAPCRFSSEAQTFEGWLELSFIEDLPPFSDSLL